MAEVAEKDLFAGQTFLSPAAQKGRDGMVQRSLELMDEAIRKYKPVAVFGLFSGGHDSLTATHIASRHPAFTAAAHINTGIGVPETREFVRETCKKFGWPLREFRAKEDCGQDYRKLVLERGFPGPFMHKKMYNRLKERAVRLLIKEAKKGFKRRDTVMLITGVRSQESRRRMGFVERIQKEKGTCRIWTAVVHDWSKHDCNDYIADNNLPRNPVVDLIHKSGECLCGAYAKPGELKELEMWYPKTAAEIRALEAEVRAAGHNWGWEEMPPKTCKKRAGKPNPAQMMLCFGCEKTAPR